MLLLLADYLEDFYGGFRVFQYVTMRTILSTLTALTFSLIFGPAFIRTLTRKQMGQFVREDGPQSHLAKAGTPTMGGGLILLSISVSTLLWADLKNFHVWVVLAVLLSFGAVGFLDDYRKLIKKQSQGLTSKEKYLYQTIFGVLAAVMLLVHAKTPQETTLIVPFIKSIAMPLSAFCFIAFTYCVIVGASNAVNLTDGLDGLAIMPTVMVAGALAIFAYVTGNAIYAPYLGIPYIAGSGELAIFCAGIFGAGLGFLWFNTYPAQVFMGDVGALSLGAALGVVAVIIRQEFTLLIMGGVFALETVSVILQVASFKLTGRRIFRMAPIHHHFELKGWAEPKIIVRFWIITLVLVLVGLSSLKIR